MKKIQAMHVHDPISKGLGIVISIDSHAILLDDAEAVELQNRLSVAIYDSAKCATSEGRK